MSDDLSAMENMVAGKPQSDTLFKDLQPKTLIDTNSGTYNGTINFDTLSLVQEYMNWRETDIQIPLVLNVSGTLSATNCLGVVSGSTGGVKLPSGDLLLANGYVNGVATPSVGGSLKADSQQIAFKQTICDIISGVVISSGDGTQIVSESTASKLINSIRLIVQNDIPFKQTFQEQLAFELDRSGDLSTSNTGFEDRGSYLLQMANCTYYVLNAGTVGTSDAYISRMECLLTIPLRLLHSFWDACDNPMKGIRWLLTFQLCKELNSVARYYGFNNRLPGSAVTYNIGKANVGGNYFPSCMLKYKAITLPDNFQEIVSENADKLNTKYIHFVTTDIYDSLTNQTVAPTSFQVSTGTVRPIRMWIYGPAAGALTSSATLGGDEPNGGARAGAFVGQSLPNTSVLHLQSLNVRLNNTNRFQQPLNSQQLLWDEVVENFQCLGLSNDHGSMINYTDFAIPNANGLSVGPTSGSQKFQGLYSWYCVNLSRKQGRTDDQALNIILDAVRMNGETAPFDMVILVEREMVAKLIFNQNSAQIIVGSSID
jgi:hypothetical protein